MESHSLERASQYLNNILLARGLLTNGKPIDFARSDRHGSITDTTMSRVINLVHDLVIRRDQDAEQREILATHIRQARADDSQRAIDLQRLQDKNTELARAAAAAESQERVLKAHVRHAEAQAKELKEQMLRMKSTLDQVRAKCLSDVRKRDTELDKLKAHMAGMQRGKKESSGMKINTINWEPEPHGRERRNGQAVDRSEWSLEQESNDFLAALVNEMSTENVSLRRIITETAEMLRELTGLEGHRPGGEESEQDAEEDGIGMPGQYRKSRQKAAQAQQQAQAQAQAEAEAQNLTSCNELAQQMAGILEHCRSILKDPSFVPIEELQIRDEEIIKLRVGWEKMASRWKEAVTMMDNWRKHVDESGQEFSKEDLSRLEFGKSIALLPNGQPVFGQDEELSSIFHENSRLEEEPDEEDLEQELPADDQGGVQYPKLPDNDKIDIKSHRRDPDGPPTAGRSPKRRASLARRAGLNIGKPIRPLQPVGLDRLNKSPNHGLASTSTNSSSRQSAQSGARSSDSAIGMDGDRPDEDDDDEVWRDENLTKSRIPRKTMKQREPPLSISEKLAAVEAEALQARRQPPSAHMEPGRKRKHANANGAKTRKAYRRRSTLSPEELAELMGIE
ncbi:hypothetical protein A1O7_01992 [Cladophialophora yegresii CBS 114405]|uniref:NIMA interactive protein n=1 Tax=Cladophialophora yegresii CBS 114405 TaxID=1182544 RepID=W9WTA1_9EURO|nr:uncharacterized protein A1O7_01992 [Cladophialophora yegresii CBS 114405]EXJ61564.1 hypothetical protein A1O7_01992 [Cladophialophora yegresii CBS 114405]